MWYNPVMTGAQRVVRILGLPERQRQKSLVDLVRGGLPVSAFEHLASYTQLTRELLADAAAIPLRTVQRRKASKQRFQPDESDRLTRIARLYDHAETVLGSRENAATWMQAPNWVLDGTRPIALADTEVGAREVEDALGRIDDGIFA